MTTMRAAVLEQLGAAPVVREVARPTPGAGQVLVQVEASGVNPLDTKIVSGGAAHAQITVPAILGIDLAGVVTEVGPGVTGFAVGDEVYGMVGGVGNEQGTLAEYVAADARLLAAKPRRLTMREAAGLPLIAITTWEAIVDRAHVEAGERVLIHGGAGGVGHVAIQIALARGASVFATGSGEALDVIARFGATPIDYTSVPLSSYVQTATGGQGFDVILDTVGGATLDESFLAVRRYTGRVVSILGWGNHNLAPLSFRGATYSGVFTLHPLLDDEDRTHHGEILREIATLVDDGALIPRVVPTDYTLDQTPDAHAAVANGARAGKVVVSIISPNHRGAPPNTTKRSEIVSA